MRAAQANTPLALLSFLLRVSLGFASA
ncbi:MAG: hypothetical protein V7640_731, partial [Betaproteobacteria bacterium]